MPDPGIAAVSTDLFLMVAVGALIVVGFGWLLEKMGKK